jgi:hypothetical protein
MPRKVESDDEETNPASKKTSGIRKSKFIPKSKGSIKKAKTVQNERQSGIAAWTKRRPAAMLEDLEDLEDEVVVVKKDLPRPRFSIVDGLVVVEWTHCRF